MNESLVNAVVERLKGANAAEIAAAVEKAKADEISTFLKSQLRPVMEAVYVDLCGTNASKSPATSQFGPFLQSAATLLGAKIIADALRENGGHSA